MIELMPVTKEDFLNIPQEYLNGFVNFVYSDKLEGIYHDNKLLGLVNLSPTFGYLSIDIMVLPKYRKLGIATYILNKIVINGDKFTNYERFICLCSSKNDASIKLLQKLHWAADTNFDDAMLNEGGEFFNIYYCNNPYFQKLARK